MEREACDDSTTPKCTAKEVSGDKKDGGSKDDAAGGNGKNKYKMEDEDSKLKKETKDKIASNSEVKDDDDDGKGEKEAISSDQQGLCQ